MLVHYLSEQSFFDTTSIHEEVPARASIIAESLKDNFEVISHEYGEIDFDKFKANLCSIHSKELLDFYSEVLKDKYFKEFRVPDFFSKRYSRESGVKGKLGYFSFDQDTPLSIDALKVAINSSYMCLEVTKDFLKDQKARYIVTRPPGHHAESNHFGGFCYLNNAALIADKLSINGKTAILDVDFHHGNGTQEIFYNRDVQFISIHGDPKESYPYTTGFKSEVGVEKGEGYNLNVPLPLGASNELYKDALDLALKRLEEFAPEFIVISLGFDFLHGDPLGGFEVDDTILSDLAQYLKKYPKLIVVQEGGYNLDRIAEYAENFASSISGN